MRKLILILSLIPSFIIAQQKNNPEADKKFTVTGNISGLPDGSEVKILSTNDNSLLASAKATAGKFTITGSVTEPGLYWLVLGAEQPQHIYIENSKISISGSKAAIKNIKVTGSSSHNDFLEFQKYLIRW